MFHITTAPLQATEQGALAGHEVKCTCGTRLTTSLGESEARRLAGDHLAYHEQRTPQRELILDCGVHAVACDGTAPAEHYRSCRGGAR